MESLAATPLANLRIRTQNVDLLLDHATDSDDARDEITIVFVDLQSLRNHELPVPFLEEPKENVMGNKFAMLFKAQISASIKFSHFTTIF